jgi:hypothetical protein
VRSFLSIAQLKLRMREARYAAAAARATWLPPGSGWEPPQDEEEVANISQQAARMANKMQALQVAQAGISVLLLSCYGCMLHTCCCIVEEEQPSVCIMLQGPPPSKTNKRHKLINRLRHGQQDAGAPGGTGRQ